MNNLFVYNFSQNSKVGVYSNFSPFILETCQRTLFISSVPLKFTKCPNEEFLNKDAYIFLLKVISGLESKLICESEIVNQFRLAFKSFLCKKDRDSQIIKVIEMLLRDSKKIRSNYLNGISQKTYSSIIRNKILNKRPNKVLIIGSGQMSIDLINQLKNKVEVYVCARNSSKVSELVKKHNIKIINWIDYKAISEFSLIVNSINSDNIIFSKDFLESWSSRNKEGLFIDISSPSALEFDNKNKDNLLLLEKIFEEGSIKENDKISKIDKAHAFILTLAKKIFFT